jgi:hypothetical protein
MPLPPLLISTGHGNQAAGDGLLIALSNKEQPVPGHVALHLFEEVTA